MLVSMAKFESVLNGRPAAREAFLRIKQIVNGSGKKEGVELDFTGVEVLTPSYGDELVSSLKKEYGDNKVKISNPNSTVLETLKAINLIS